MSAYLTITIQAELGCTISSVVLVRIIVHCYIILNNVPPVDSVAVLDAVVFGVVDVVEETRGTRQ